MYVFPRVSDSRTKQNDPAGQDTAPGGKPITGVRGLRTARVRALSSEALPNWSYTLSTGQGDF